MYDLNDHSMSIAARMESIEDSPAEISFSRYCRRIEALLGSEAWTVISSLRATPSTPPPRPRTLGVTVAQYVAGRRTAYYADRDAMRRDRGL